MEIRDAVESDFEEITAIYNEVLTHSTAIYNDQPTNVEERLAWWRARLQQGFPALVATAIYLAVFPLLLAARRVSTTATLSAQAPGGAEQALACRRFQNRLHASEQGTCGQRPRRSLSRDDHDGIAAM